MSSSVETQDHKTQHHRIHSTQGQAFRASLSSSQGRRNTSSPKVLGTKEVSKNCTLPTDAQTLPHCINLSVFFTFLFECIYLNAAISEL